LTNLLERRKKQAIALSIGFSRVCTSLKVVVLFCEKRDKIPQKAFSYLVFSVGIYSKSCS
jgi:hypothetical protein